MWSQFKSSKTALKRFATLLNSIKKACFYFKIRVFRDRFNISDSKTEAFKHC